VIAMLSGVLEGQQSMRADTQEIKGVLNQHTQVLNRHTQVLNEHTLTLAEHGRRLNDLTGQVTSLREAVTSYHASVLGHGILISELDARVRRIEQHLDLSPPA
jgi:chromosome segregation ATPase